MPLQLTTAEVLGAGKRVVVSSGGDNALADPLDDRQRRALGAAGNLNVRRLSVVLVGAGGTGSPLAEQLVRMGVARLTVIDPGVVDDASNLRRIIGARPPDLTRRTPKSEVIATHLKGLALETEIVALPIDVRTWPAFHQLLDADVVISTTDTHSSRAFVNQVAYQYSLPTIDVGVVVGTSSTGLVSGMPTEIRVLLPDNGCLHCRGVLDPRRLRAENLLSELLEQELGEGYVQGLGQPVGSLAALNSFAASLAALTLLRLCTSGLDETSFIVDGWDLYVQPLNASISPGCVCSAWRAQADRLQIAGL